MTSLLSRLPRLWARAGRVSNVQADSEASRLYRSGPQTGLRLQLSARSNCAPGLGDCQRGLGLARGLDHSSRASTERGSVRVDFAQPLVADAEVVRNLVADDVAYTYGEVGLVAGQALDRLLEDDDSVGKGHMIAAAPSG